MSPASPRMRHFAKRLTICERNANSPSETTNASAFHVCERLRVPLVALAGTAGSRELLLCALLRAKEESPCLGAVQVKADGALGGLEELHAKHIPDELFEGGVVLVAQLLGLLTAFIGETLTLRFVREVWPEVPLDNWDIGKGEKDGKAE
jgi:hypothetical protein